MGIVIRDRCDVGCAQAIPKRFKAAKQECLVLLYWPSKAKAELIPFKLRLAEAVKEVAGIEIVVAQKLENRSVQLIRARFAYSVHDSTGSPARSEERRVGREW